ncbi:MAG TPA: hypothetical protein VM661_08155 [Candidatus Sulfotelmatobacter sp.]|jgi:predicted DNA-binding protein|nr:hypothetical protein [Candidatus Sulfotelmatobacter sp.]
MSELILSLTPEVKARLEALAVKLERPVGECLEQAVMEFLDNWEDYLRTVAALDIEEERPILRAVND